MKKTQSIVINNENINSHIYCLYVGFIIPRDMAIMRYNSFAGNEAEINFVESVLGNFKSVILSYTYNKFADKNCSLKKQTPFVITGSKAFACYGISTIPVPFVNKAFASFAIRKDLKKIIEYIKKRDFNAKILIITCNSYPIFSAAALSVSKRYSLIKVCYLIDGFYYEGKLNVFRRLNETLAKRNLKKYDKVIGLSKNVLSSFCLKTQKQIAITPVVFHKQQGEMENRYLLKGKFNIVFAGGIAPLNGIDLYCELSKLLNKNVAFHLFGKGELSDNLREFVADKNNIFFHGPISHDELMDIEQKAEALIIMRPTKQSKQNAITKYGIPFKLIEYLQSGTPVIASYMEAVPSDLQQFINICEANAKSVNKLVNQIVNNYEEYAMKAQSAKKYMQENCTWDHYSFVLKQFLENE